MTDRINDYDIQYCDPRGRSWMVDIYRNDKLVYQRIPASWQSGWLGDGKFEVYFPLNSEDLARFRDSTEPFALAIRVENKNIVWAQIRMVRSTGATREYPENIVLVVKTERIIAQ